MNRMRRALSLLFALCPILAVPCAPALSLGEAVAQQKSAVKTESAVLCSAKAGNVHYKVTKLVLAKALYLPESLRPLTIRPEDGRLVLLIEGRAVNEGAEKASYEQPHLLVSNGSKHDSVNHFYYKRSGSTTLNPMESYSFAVVYLVSPSLLEGSKLLCSDGEWINPKTAAAPLPIDSHTTIADNQTLYGVTNNMFDVEKVQNPVEQSAEKEVARAREAAKRQQEQEEAEERLREWKMRQAEAELNYQLNRLESASRELESELRNLDREVESAARELENELRNLQYDSDF